MNAHDVLMYGHLWVHKHVDGLTVEQWQHPDVCGYWSTKDIIAHLASYEWVLGEVFQTCIESAPTPTLDRLTSQNGDAFNAEQVGARQQKSPKEALSEYDQAYEKVMQLLPRISAEELRQPGALPWYGSQYSLEDFIVYQYYGHKREHMAQVAVFRDTLR
jgi:hypothetical protein